MVPCASLVMYESVLYDDFYHSHFMSSNVVVKLQRFGNSLSCLGNSLPMVFHPTRINLFLIEIMFNVINHNSNCIA